MRKVLVSPRARSDLKNILKFTLKRFGERQAIRYMDMLKDSISSLEESPERGLSRDELREGYWSIRAGRHLIFYVFNDSSIRIRRVLHEKMDVGRHL